MSGGRGKMRPSKVVVAFKPKAVWLTSYARQARGATVVVGQVKLPKAHWRQALRTPEVKAALGTDRTRQVQL